MSFNHQAEIIVIDWIQYALSTTEFVSFNQSNAFELEACQRLGWGGPSVSDVE
jgi:hypothetical protein